MGLEDQSRVARVDVLGSPDRTGSAGPWIVRGRFWKGQNRALIGRLVVDRRHTDFTTGHGGRFLSVVCGGRA